MSPPAKPGAYLTELLPEPPVGVTPFSAIHPDQQKASPVSDQLMRDWLRKVVENHWLTVPLRAQAGRLLSDLGDPRSGITVKRVLGNKTVPDIDWQEIPAGRFRVGSEANDKEADDAEKPAHEIDLPRFFISRYPATNAQYRCFIEAGMYQDQAFWREKLPEVAYQWLKDNLRQVPHYWTDRQWNLDNHPVVGVSWYEALAYSVWLNEWLAEIKPDGISANLQIRLPTEAEWEYAARGAAGLRYAWGNEADANLGNYADTGLKRTSAVGLFEPGKAFGLYDMSGNVWEWTLSRWGKGCNKPDFSYDEWQQQEPQRNLLDAEEICVLRGGSWDNSGGNVRSACRSRYELGGRYFSIGFRLVLAPPVVGK